jgi:glutamate dehydrogenase
MVASLKDRLASDIAGRAQRRMGEAAAELARAFVTGMPAGDLESANPDTLTAATLGLFAFMRLRPPGEVALRAFNPIPGQDGWLSAHSVVEIINDDMPFLVDSVAAELARRGITIHLLVHPVLPVRRDAAGLLSTLSPEGRAESVMHIEIDRQDARALAVLTAALGEVLAQVRLAVGAWTAMRGSLREATAELAGSKARMPADELAEAVAFLDWLHDDHFTFLGSRSFDFSADGTITTTPDSGMGILRDPTQRVFDDAMALADLPPELKSFLMRPSLLLVTKSGRRATVHRPVHMDVIGVKRFGRGGEVVGMQVFLGLFTSAAYTRSPAQIPLLRRKVTTVAARAGFSPNSHDGKALAAILDSYPRDELFQISEEALFHTALGVLDILDRPRPALFVRLDEFERFASCLVYVPRDRYDTPLRLAVVALLEQAFEGRLEAYFTQVADQPLARLHILIRVKPGRLPVVNLKSLETAIAGVTRSWPEQLQHALVQAHGEGEGVGLARRYAQAFPASYRERDTAAAAVADIEHVDAVVRGGDLALDLCRRPEAAPHEGRLKVYRLGRPVPLSDVLPMLEAMGLRVIAEVPHEIIAAGDISEPVWIHDFTVETADGSVMDVAGRRGAFQEALAAAWRGEAESDGFNRLVLAAGLDWREVAILRTYAKYLRQAGSAYSQAYMERALVDNPVATAALVALFRARFDPAGSGEADAADAAVATVLDKVAGADDDRILRRFLNLIRATLRTNWFLGRTAIAVKLDSRAIDELPAPRPLVEVFVCSPAVEAVHLRGGKVARGGIRWSDRREDFRTEVLGLMKAQMVKNAVIVPVGAKGGFVVKRQPASRDEAIACYRTFIGALLDLTDNLDGARVVPPEGVRRRDGDDPYLVVAADKGTASFSDIANAISVERGFWLGDAFASGGSHGYDHKGMGITARGAWEAVKRHFRELGSDVQAEDFTVAGVGDMAGDVFGNAMLCSPHIRLVAAFNHSHIFVDPDPHPERSFVERQRLFRETRAWPDYDLTLISEGGGVWSRAAKSIPISSAMQARFAITATSLTPTELIRAILQAPVDLLFFGGIGTVVKARTESHAEVGDRANDAIRVDARTLKARVVGEGANLAVTQLGRIEYALTGGRLNTDAIDNSAGVDTSDHEVNIKILLDEPVRAGEMTGKQRDRLLGEMTDDVAALVLGDNYLQTQAISMLEAQGPDILDAEARFMRLLEKAGRLDRGLEFLPADETLTERAAHKTGLTRPELAVLLAYGKIWLYEHVLHSDLPDDPFTAADLARYFPGALQSRFAADIPRHRLRREIVATVVTNSIVNRVGGAFVADVMERSGHLPAQVARAYIVARDAFSLREVWQAIEALDGSVPAAAQTAMAIETNRLVERATLWVLRSVPSPFSLSAAIAELAPGVAALAGALPAVLPADAAAAVAARVAQFVAQGVPEAMAQRVGNLIVLASAADIVRIAGRTELAVEAAGQLYFTVGARLGLGWLRASAERLSGRGHWQKLAAAAAIEDLYGHQRDLTLAVAAAGSIEAWSDTRRAAMDRADSLVAEIKAAPHIDLAMITVANRQLRTLLD